MRAVRRLMRPSAGAVTCGIGALPHRARGAAPRPAPFRPRRAFNPSCAATSCASALLAAARAGRRCCRTGSRTSCSGLARSKAACGLGQTGLRLDDLASAPGRSPRMRASEASFCASWASSDSCTRTAQDVALLHAVALVDLELETRKPSTSGATRISSRGTSEPVTTTVSMKSAVVDLDDRDGRRRRGGGLLVLLVQADLARGRRARAVGAAGCRSRRDRRRATDRTAMPG